LHPAQNSLQLHPGSFSCTGYFSRSNPIQDLGQDALHHFSIFLSLSHYACRNGSQRLKYPHLAKSSQALRGRNLTGDSQADGAPMVHHLRPLATIPSKVFVFLPIGHWSYASETPGGLGQCPSARFSMCAEGASFFRYSREYISNGKPQVRFSGFDNAPSSLRIHEWH
jgi:hypothetical protein